MTESELEIEYRYRMAERLGLLCGEASPTSEELDLALSEAQEAVEQLS